MQRVLIAGEWIESVHNGNFQATNPATGETLAGIYPISSWTDCDRALDAAHQSLKQMLHQDGEQRALFLEAFAAQIEKNAATLCEAAHKETALPIKPRLADIELPRTISQLRQAAQAARDGSYTQAVIDTKLNIRSCFAAIGPVVVFGPNNFPFAFNGISGGDFAAAIAAGCPVIAKAHPLHPTTSRLLAECAKTAVDQTGMPAATVQMMYHLNSEDGLRLVGDSRVGATAFTGSRTGGMALKHAADIAGKPIYLEMSSLNPIVFLPGALDERCKTLIIETADSGLAGVGQFCTSPNLLFVTEGPSTERFIQGIVDAYRSRASAPLLSFSGRDALHHSAQSLIEAGASVLIGGQLQEQSSGACYCNTVLYVSGKQFIENGKKLQEEAFGNLTTVVRCANDTELLQALASLEGNLTASIYSHSNGSDDALYESASDILRSRCGRLLNDKMPTGVALSPAMNHGGPYPSTGHPGFTSVGIPRSMQRFCTLQCYDNVRAERLPGVLRDLPPHDRIWRYIDGSYVLGNEKN